MIYEIERADDILLLEGLEHHEIKARGINAVTGEIQDERSWIHAYMKKHQQEEYELRQNAVFDTMLIIKLNMENQELKRKIQTYKNALEASFDKPKKAVKEPPTMKMEIVRLKKKVNDLQNTKRMLIERLEVLDKNYRTFYDRLNKVLNYLQSTIPLIAKLLPDIADEISLDFTTENKIVNFRKNAVQYWNMLRKLRDEEIEEIEEIEEKLQEHPLPENMTLDFSD